MLHPAASSAEESEHWRLSSLSRAMVAFASLRLTSTTTLLQFPAPLMPKNNWIRLFEDPLPLLQPPNTPASVRAIAPIPILRNHVFITGTPSLRIERT